MGIFDALHIGYSGLSVSQTAINITSHNISNANTEGYSRQSVIQRVKAPTNDIPGAVGTGAQITTITRAHDEYVYGRLKNSSAQVAYTEYMEKSLQEIASYESEIDGLGISQDLQDFFNAWSDISQNPDDDAQKIVLVTAMDSLAQNLNDFSTKLSTMQDRLNEEFKSGIDEVNRLASDIVELNKNINKIENANNANANDLRDQRDQLELELAKMLNIEVSKGSTFSTTGDANMTDMGNDYNINVGGFNIVDGTTFHPLRAEDNINTTNLNSVFYVDQNQQKVEITQYIKSGELGAILDLRGDNIDSNTGLANNSKIQDYISNLDTFTKTLVQSVNNLYASSAQDTLITDPFEDFSTNATLSQLDDINEGTFDIKVYDPNGELVATKSITIDEKTTLALDLNNNPNANSIVEQFNAANDDNGDNDATNDVDDFFVASMIGDQLRITSKTGMEHYTIAIEDHGTNFAGATGINKLFEGETANTVAVASDIKNNPSNVTPYKAPIDGNGDLAADMVELQYADLTFLQANGSESEQTLDAFYRYSSARIASDGEQSTINKEAALVLQTTVQEEMTSISGVDMDEELVNLMKYQTAYQANAKVITTIDQMIDALLSIK